MRSVGRPQKSGDRRRSLDRDGERSPRPFTLYAPDDLDLWLRERARRNRRTLTAETILVLEEGRRVLEVAGPPEEGR